MKPILSVRDLQKVYPDGTKAIKGMSFDIMSDERVAIIGRSGAGKSTLLRCLNQLIPATSGEVTFLDQSVTRASGGAVRRIRRQIGIIFQQFHLVDRVSVIDNVLHGRLGYMNALQGAFGLYSSVDRKRAEALLERVGLGDKANQRADALSGGQQQRVAIARACMQNPKLMLADEPIASLDPVTAITIMDMLTQLTTEQNIPLIVNLHQVDVAKTYATRIIGVRAGEIVYDGTPDDLTEEMLNWIYQGEVTQLHASKPVLNKESHKVVLV